MKKIIVLTLLLFTAFLSAVTPTYALNEIVGPDAIFKQKDKVLTMSTIIDLYSSSEGDIEVLVDTYTGYGDISGIYTIKFGVEGTAFEKDVDVNVRSTIGDCIAVTSTDDVYTIHMYKNKSLTLNEIIDVLVNVQMIEVTSTTEILVLTDTYSDNTDSVGIYTFEFYLASTSGLEETYTTYIKVLNTEKLLPDIIVVDPSDIDWNNLFLITTAAICCLAALIVIMKFQKRFRGKKGLI